MTIDNYRRILNRYWGYDDFRGIQADIILSITAGHDTLGLMPTGGGKSITFQVPAIAMSGTCIVVTPLISLMKDQVSRLRRMGIPAAAIYSGMQRDDVLRTLENCILGGTKLLYVSPERLSSDLFIRKLRHMNVSFITVDEAHCISQWGYDFRPAYLKIAEIRDVHPKASVLALTATATPAVVNDIVEKLSVTPASGSISPVFNIFQMSFARKNLAYSVCRTNDKYHELVSRLSDCCGSAIVYVRSRRHAREICKLLTDNGLNATFYHAGLESAERDERQRAWQEGRTTIMVATNAFGMGIDKADVRLVMHFDVPDSVEAYFQEAGRAGRDGKPADAILLYNSGDKAKLTKRTTDTCPEKDYIRQVYEHLAYFFQIAVDDGLGVCREFSLEEFCKRFHHFPVRAHAALLILEQAGYIQYEEEADSQARVRFLVNRDDLYRLKEITSAEDAVVVALLRNYGGLFADYCYIDESLLGYDTGYKVTEVHDLLKSLSARHLISFIPRRQIPQVRYIQRRVESSHLRFPKEIYELKLAQYKRRVDFILHYAESTTTCRQRLLLEYFGETDAHDCGCCDVCYRKANPLTDGQIDEACGLILGMLSDGKPHLVTELHSLKMRDELLRAALNKLFTAEKVKRDGGYMMLFD